MNGSRFSKKLVAVASLAFVGSLCLSACSEGSGKSTQPDRSQYSHASRVKLYTSVADLAKDSTVVVSGLVVSQKVVRDIDPTTEFTISEVQVADAPKSTNGIIKGGTILLRQLGSDKQIGPARIVETGKRYLLYLTASGLEGDLGSQYYVTGGTAGLYEALNSKSTSEIVSFSHGASDEGDQLPSQLSITSALG